MVYKAANLKLINVAWFPIFSPLISIISCRVLQSGYAHFSHCFWAPQECGLYQVIRTRRFIGCHFSAEGIEAKTAISVSLQHFLKWLKAVMKGQRWTNKGRGEKGGGKKSMNQALQTLGCVITHRFNNSPPSTKAAWLQGRGKRERKGKKTHTCSWLFSKRTTSS